MSKKTDRHSEIIKYLNTHGRVKSTELLSVFNIKKSTLSEDLKELKDKGYPINNSEHGFIYMEADTEKTDFQKTGLEKTGIKKDVSNVTVKEYYEGFSKEDIRKWLLLYAFNILIATEGGPATTDEILGYLEIIYKNIPDENATFSRNTFFSDLQKLYHEGYLTRSSENELFQNNYYHTTTLTPRMIIITETSAKRFLRYLETEPDNILYQDMKKRLCEAYEKLKPSKEEFLQSTAIKHISDFIQTQYKHKCLSIKYNGGKKPFTYYNFETGLIMYSAEKNRFFILGRCDAYKKDGKAYKLLRADKILKIKETDIDNELFMSDEVLDIYDYMFEASLEYGESIEPVDIEILLENTPQNLNRIRLLCDSRANTASYRIINNGAILYEDSILGTTDILPLIRYWGHKCAGY